MLSTEQLTMSIWNVRLLLQQKGNSGWTGPDTLVKPQLTLDSLEMNVNSHVHSAITEVRLIDDKSIITCCFSCCSISPWNCFCNAAASGTLRGTLRGKLGGTLGGTLVDTFGADIGGLRRSLGLTSSSSDKDFVTGLNTNNHICMYHTAKHRKITQLNAWLFENYNFSVHNQKTCSYNNKYIKMFLPFSGSNAKPKLLLCHKYITNARPLFN